MRPNFFQRAPSSFGSGCSLRRTILLAAAALLMAGKALAIGSSVDVELIDRASGHALQVHPFRGSHYVAGRPGERYAIRLSNRTGGRVLTVISVDGVNIISGQTASWQQSGYVLEAWQSHEVTGWRKNRHEVAAFEFAALPHSYAARTGRPEDVGVVGVAVFAERMPPPAAALPFPGLGGEDRGARLEGRASSNAGKSAQNSDAPSAQERAMPERDTRLGTGHGAREASPAQRTTFMRSSRRPIEVVSLRYDSHENLVRAGIVRGVGFGLPRPFPQSDSYGFVPDPPRW